MPRIGKFIQRENRLVMPMAEERLRDGVSFWGNENVIKWIGVVTAQLDE